MGFGRKIYWRAQDPRGNAAGRIHFATNFSWSKVMKGAEKGWKKFQMHECSVSTDQWPLPEYCCVGIMANTRLALVSWDLCSKETPCLFTKLNSTVLYLAFFSSLIPPSLQQTSTSQVASGLENHSITQILAAHKTKFISPSNYWGLRFLDHKVIF